MIETYYAVAFVLIFMFSMRFVAACGVLLGQGASEEILGAMGGEASKGQRLPFPSQWKGSLEDALKVVNEQILPLSTENFTSVEAPMVQLSPEIWHFEDFLDHAEESLERYPQLGKRIDKMVPKVVLEPEFWRLFFCHLYRGLHASPQTQELTTELLEEESDKTSNAIISCFRDSATFKVLAQSETEAISRRDAEDAEKLAAGIAKAVAKGVLEANPPVEATFKVDVLGKSADAVAEGIIDKLGKAPASGCIVVLTGLSGTGKGTTVSKLQASLPNAASWSNGNVFRALTLLAVTHCEQSNLEFKGEVLTPDLLQKFISCLEFGKFNGRFDIRISGLGYDLLVSEVANTVLKEPRVSKNIPTVAEMTQGEVVCFAAKAAELMRADGMNVLMEGRSQTLDYIRTPHRSPERAGQPCVLARDRSQNGTGLCRLGPDGLPDLVNIWRLSSGPELLEDGQVFVIPLRSKSRQVSQNEVLETSLFHFYMYPGPGGNWPPRPQALIGQGNGRPEEAVLPARVPDKLADSDILPDCYDPSSGIGRWNYQARLGEGGLGIVYRAYDCRGNLGHVAIKVLKHPQRAYWGKQHCFAMHRESQWSLQKIHNRQDGRYCESSAKLFARYLEDHTGLLQVCPGSFDERRKRFETPGLDWEKDGPTVVAAPYVVMELVEGEAMHVAMDREWRAPSKHGAKDPPPMTVEEKRQVLIQAARALEYLATFGLIHRDFRGCNMHLAERAVDGAECVLKVLDLGVMITDEDWQQSNTNDAVQAFRRRGETEEKRRRYDWLPWEVRISADGIGPPLNFEKPVHSFDMFSLGVLALHLTIGRTEARSRLSAMESAGAGKDLTAVEVIDTSMLGLDPTLHRYMLGPAALRPAPSVVVRSIEAKLADPQKLPLTSKANVGRLPRGRSFSRWPLPSMYTGAHPQPQMKGRIHMAILYQLLYAILANLLAAGSTECQARSEADVELAEEREIAEMDVQLLQTKVQGTMMREGQSSVPKRVVSKEGGVCWSNEDCCLEDADGYCPLFCKEGTEIDTHNAKGWEVKGQCMKKWPGYCREDEQCKTISHAKGESGDPTYIGNAICFRSAGSLDGSCRNDTMCDAMSCGRGSCRWGKCTCDYGVGGDRCDKSTEAFAFLLYGNSSENLISVRVLVKSMRAAGAIQDILAIVPKNLIGTIPPKHLEILQRDGVKIYPTDPIPMPAVMDADPVIHKRWSGVMNKFAVWRMTEYSQVALLDTDMVFDVDSESPGKIFSECSAPLCAVRDGDSRFMNAGVMVITPSSQRLMHLLQVLADEQHHFAMPEQSFLTQYCKNKKFKMKLQFLDKKWNSCVGGGMLHNTGWESTGYNVLHSCSWTGKPPNMKMCFPGHCDSNQDRDGPWSSTYLPAAASEWHTVLVWQFFHMEVDSCIRHPDEGSCHKNSCQWCGKYCGTKEIECNKKLFNQTYIKDTWAVDGCIYDM
eukprot:s1628_g14.t3